MCIVEKVSHSGSVLESAAVSISAHTIRRILKTDSTGEIIMAKSTTDYEREFIAEAKQRTGRTVEEWMNLIKASGTAKHAEIRTWLKAEHKLDHMQATFLTFIFENGGKPAFEAGDLRDTLFAGREKARELTDALEASLTEAYPSIEFVPKKTYVSINGEKVMGCATPIKDGLRFGLDLGDMPFEGRVQKAKSLGAMPNVTHMIELRDPGEIDAEVLRLTGVAFERTRKLKK
jgi:hypothetical protein